MVVESNPNLNKVADLSNGDQAAAMAASIVQEQSTGWPETLSSPYQHTLLEPFALTGIGLHTGTSVQVTVRPANANQGRYFLRTDLEEAVPLSAQLSTVYQTQLSTTLKQNNLSVTTVEHLLAALIAMGVDNAQIELDGPEVPILDGSAQRWVNAILNVGYKSQSKLRQVMYLQQPVIEQVGDAFVMATPHTHTTFSYGIDFSCEAIGRQWCSFDFSDFVSEIAPARTFGRAEDVESLQAKGFIKGGSLENALVCRQNKWLNPPLRFANEPVRHKLLDLIGDLSLLGVLPLAHYVAYKASHSLHFRFAQNLQQEMTGLLT